MAVLGLTKLEAVNRILRVINEWPVSALDTGGASIQGRAEQVLDEMNTAFQAAGLEENTIYNKSYTADGSGNVTVAAGVLNVSHLNRRVALRGDQVYNLSDNTANWGAGATVLLNVVEEIAFESLPPATKEVVCREAEIQFQQRWRGSPQQNQYLMVDRAKFGSFTKPPTQQHSVVRPIQTFVPAQPQQDSP